MSVRYEWDIEQWENDEIVDHNFRDKLSEYSLRELEEIDGDKYRLVLFRPETDTAYKSWAYAFQHMYESYDGKNFVEWVLPPMLKASDDDPVCYVPHNRVRELCVMQEDGKWYKEENGAVTLGASEIERLKSDIETLNGRLNLALLVIEDSKQRREELLGALKQLAGPRFQKMYGDWSEYKNAQEVIAKTEGR